MTPEARIAQLEADNARQREQIAALVARVQELEARLAKDSHNSGKPLSSDGLARKTRSLRKRTGKKPGGQIGHRGDTLRLVATPDAVVEHRSAVCITCQSSLAEALVVRYERRQVYEVPPLRLVIQEHWALHLRCPACHGRIPWRASPGCSWVYTRGRYSHPPFDTVCEPESQLLLFAVARAFSNFRGTTHDDPGMCRARRTGRNKSPGVMLW